uniref:Uncharacterized protein n=1 Tax=Aegilops tauschii subsp. strangulata TaxID=200361 RepID=A0A453BWA2_AEGTS
MASEKLVARKGRLRQRYDNEYRLVAGCVPYRVDKDGQLEVLMVSTANRDDLVFPKVTPTHSTITHISSATCIHVLINPWIDFFRAAGRTTRTSMRRHAARRWRRPESGATSIETRWACGCSGARADRAWARAATARGAPARATSSRWRSPRSSSNGRSRKPTEGGGSPQRTRTGSAGTTGCARR